MRLAVAQIVTGADPTANLGLIREYALRAKAAGAELVVFPEAAMRAFGNPLAEIAEPLDGPWATAVRAIARDLDIAVVAGMFTPGDGGRVRNTLLVTGPGLDTSYDKIHLFDAFGFAESDSVDAGTAPVTFDLNGTTIGLATCYDVRFPALFTANARAGAAINIVCASWRAARVIRQRSGCRPPAPRPPGSATVRWCRRWVPHWWRWAAHRSWPWSTSIPPSSPMSGESFPCWPTHGASSPAPLPAPGTCSPGRR